MKKYGKPRSRPPTWVEKMAFRGKINDAITAAIAKRLEELPSIRSTLLPEGYFQPDAGKVADDVMHSLYGGSEGRQDRRMALQDTIKARMGGSPMGYTTGLDMATESGLADAGYGGDSGFDYEPDSDWIENSRSYLRPLKQIGDF